MTTQSQFLVNLSYGGLASQSNLRANNRVSPSSCQITRTNRSWALPVSFKVEKFQLQRGRRRRGSPCFGESEGLVKNGIGDADGIIIVDHGSRRRESNLMLGNSFVSLPSPSSFSLLSLLYCIVYFLYGFTLCEFM
jgi:hypothetical protein